MSGLATRASAAIGLESREATGIRASARLSLEGITAGGDERVTVCEVWSMDKMVLAPAAEM